MSETPHPKTALLIIDVQTAAVAAGPYEVDRVMDHIATLLETARAAGTPVIHVQHDGKPGEAEEPHTPGWEIHPRVAPVSGEPVFRKRFNSAFLGSGLHDHLQREGIRRLVLVGIQTEYCVDTSIRVGFELGYTIILPELTNTTVDNGSIPAREIYTLFNRRIFADRFASLVTMEQAQLLVRWENGT